jgi:hypothetical protein
MINGRVRWLSADRTRTGRFHTERGAGPPPVADGETTAVTRPPGAGFVQPALQRQGPQGLANGAERKRPGVVTFVWNAHT